MTNLRNYGFYAALLVLLAAPLSAASQTVSISQLPNRHIVVTVAGDLAAGCASNPTYTLPSFSFTVLTVVLCTPDSPLAPYTASVDFGVLPDGTYEIDWLWIAFGPVADFKSQPFTIRNGVIVAAGTPIPTLSDFALVFLGLLVCLMAFVSLRARRRVTSPNVPCCRAV